jgi:RNA polymerase primary sigma factor
VVNTGYLVRLPVHAFENLFKICRLRQQHPLAETTELLKTFNRGVGESKQISLTQLKTLILYAKIFLNTLSLNHVQIDESGLELQDMIPDNRNSPVEDIILHNSLKRDLMKALKTLTPREAKVLILRYGLQDNQSRSLELVGKAIGVTRERIRQIEKQAIKSLRCPERSKLIACYQEE